MNLTLKNVLQTICHALII